MQKKLNLRIITFLMALLLPLSVLSAFTKGEIVYKDGIRSECNIEEYDLGKWIVFIDENGTKRIIAWDLIQEVVFTQPDSIAASDSLTISANLNDLQPAPAAAETETVKTDSVKKEEPTMTIAQKLAKRERERKEKEAAEAKRKADYEAEIKIMRQQQKAEEKKESGFFNIFKKKETAEEGNKFVENKKNRPVELTEDEKQRKEQVELKAQEKMEEEAAKKEEENKSIFNIFKKKKAEKAVGSTAAVAETGSAVTQDDQTKEEEFREEIREDNNYQKPEFDIDKKSGKVSAEYYKTLESDATRRCWLEEGGRLMTKGFTVNYVYTGIDFEGSDFTLHGIGYTGSMYVKTLNPPNYETGKNIWSSLGWGFTGSTNVTFGRMEFPEYEMKTDLVLMTVELSVPVGYTFGLGKYLSRSDWKGLMLGVFWKPTFNMNMTSATTTMPDPFNSGEEWVLTDDPVVDTSFSLTGLQWTFDFGSFSDLAEDLAQEAHLSISGFILPTSDMFMFSIGIGMIWY